MADEDVAAAASGDEAERLMPYHVAAAGDSQPDAGVGAGNAFFDPKVYEALNHASEADLKHGQEIGNKMIGAIEAGDRDMQSVTRPQLQAQPTPPKFTGEAIQGWMGAFAALAALAGGGARGNATTALNAFAGGIKGLMQGNQELFKNNMETWEASSRKVLADNQAKLDQYDLIMRNKKMSMDAKLSALKIQAKMNDDSMTYHLAQAQDYEKLAGLFEKSQQMQQQAEYKQTLMEGYKKRVSIAMENQQANKDAGEELADDIAHGRANPDDLGGVQMKKFTLDALDKKYPDFNRAKAHAQWRAANKQVDAVNSQQMNRFTQTATSVLNAMQDLRSDAEALKLGGVRVINDIELQGIIQTQAGSPLADVAQDYITKMATVKSEMASVEMGGYAPIQDAWKQVDQQLNANMGYYQMQSSLRALEQVLNYRLDAIPNFKTLGPAGPNPYTGNPGRQVGTRPPQPSTQQGGTEEDPEKDLMDSMQRLGIQ